MTHLKTCPFRLRLLRSSIVFIIVLNKNNNNSIYSWVFQPLAPDKNSFLVHVFDTIGRFC